MGVRSIITIAALLASIGLASNAQERTAPPLTVYRPADRLLWISDGGLGEQLAVTSRKGIVVFGTLWSTEIAKAFRSRIEAEFGTKSVAAVVLGTPRPDYAGGGGAYEGVETYAHERSRSMLANFASNPTIALRPLIEMWRWKEGLARDRLASGTLDAERARVEGSWMDACRRIADDLSSSCDMRLPTRTFRDRINVDLGDLHLELIYLGAVSGGWPGLVARIPELKLVAFGPLSFHAQHLLPYLNSECWQDLEIPRAMAVLDEILADEADIGTLIVGSGPWPVSELRARRRYMGELWTAVQAACARGLSLETMRSSLSIDAAFPYLKNLAVWKEQGAPWCLEEHADNITRFWGQFQRFAARQVFRAAIDSGTDAAMAQYRALRDRREAGVIFDDGSMDSLVDALFSEGDLRTVLAVIQANVEAFPASAIVHARAAEALLLQGDPAGARVAARKALELDPGNQRALLVNERLGAK
jgi:hypothetical protein